LEKIDRPLTVYAVLQKEGQAPYTIHADYLKSIKRYQIDADLKYIMTEKVNGDYQLSVISEDPRAQAKYE
jgi:hypothetical protein